LGVAFERARGVSSLPKLGGGEVDGMKVRVGGRGVKADRRGRRGDGFGSKRSAGERGDLDDRLRVGEAKKLLR